MRIALLLVGLVGCPWVGGGQLARVRDGDGDGEDGLLFGGDDCDDDDALVHPDAEEIWGNEVDENCDGNTDDRDEDGVPEVADCDDRDPTVAALQSYYVDLDEDGVAGPDPIERVCKPEDGMLAEVGKDCDDGDPTIFPGAPELCDELDNDCDQDADEPEDIVWVTWWTDDDGDGVGYGTGTSTCGEPPEGSADHGADCDDEDATRYPDAPELCDGLDNDCDGEADEGLTFHTYTLDRDGDGHGGAPLNTDGAAFGPPVVVGGEIESCLEEPPPTYAAEADDCDDDDPEVIWFEQWVDADLDGFGASGVADTSSCVPLPGLADNALDCQDDDARVNPLTTWFPDADGDGFGDPRYPSAPSCTAPPSVVLQIPVAQDCDDARADVSPLASWDDPHDGVDQDCDDGTELDEDGDGQLDFPSGCPTVAVGADPTTLQQVLDQLALRPGVCGVVHLGSGEYGAVTARTSVALVREPWADVRFVSTTGGTAVTGLTEAPIELVLEKLRFEGWDRAVDLGAGDLLASELGVVGGEALALRTSDASSRLTLYDARFDGVDNVYDPSWSASGGFGTVHVERALVLDAVSPRVVLFGGMGDTFVEGLTVQHSAAIAAVFTVPSGPGLPRARTIELRDVRIVDTLGRALDVPLEDADRLVLDGLRLERNTTVDRQLVAVRAVGGLQAAQVQVTGLFAFENRLEPSGVAANLRDTAMFDFGGAELAMTGTSFVANETDETWLLAGQGQIASTAFAGRGWRGVRFEGAMDHVTFVGLGQIRGPVAEGAGLRGLRLTNALVADCASSFGWTVDTDRVLVEGATPTCSGCANVANVQLLRYDGLMPAEWWDLAVLPGSPAIDPSCAAFGSCDLGAWTPTTAPERYATTDDVLYDSWEVEFLGSTAASPAGDEDADGLTNLQEFFGGTLPDDPDVDRDGAMDGADGDPWDATVQ